MCVCVCVVGAECVSRVLCVTCVCRVRVVCVPTNELKLKRKLHEPGIDAPT